MRRLPTSLAMAALALLGAASEARAGCVPAVPGLEGTRNPAIPGPDFCISAAYPGVQADSNGDGFGTRCDADYASTVPPIKQDCAVTTKFDYPIFVRAYRAGVGPDQDHDGNGVVNAADFVIFRDLYGSFSSPD